MCGHEALVTERMSVEMALLFSIVAFLPLYQREQVAWFLHEGAALEEDATGFREACADAAEIVQYIDGARRT